MAYPITPQTSIANINFTDIEDLSLEKLVEIQQQVAFLSQENQRLTLENDLWKREVENLTDSSSAQEAAKAIRVHAGLLSTINDLNHSIDK